jgi:hypothetical protein
MSQREAYHRYLSTMDWHQKRQAAREAAGHRCEFRRCGVATSLDTHHVTYRSVGNEAPRDLMVLCKRHHMMMHVLEWKCRVCGDNVYHHHDEALAFIDGTGINFARCRAIREIDPFRPTYCRSCADRLDA